MEVKINPVNAVNSLVHAEEINGAPKKVTPRGLAGQMNPAGGANFAEAMTRASLLQFSKHAETRLNSRNINLSAEQLARVTNGVSEARQKGVRDSLVLVDGVALVVNVGSGTVITAVNNGGEKKLFTNIDGAVIV